MVRAWKAHRPVRGPVVAALLAVPHRHQRLPRHAQRPPAPGPADGPRPAVDGRRRRSARRCPRTRGSSRSPTTACCPTGGDPAERRRGPRVDPARVRRRAAAPAAAPAGGADPARGAALAGHRGRRAARHHRRVGQQRAAAGPGHARRASTSRPTPAGTDVDADAAGAAGPLRRRVRALRHRRARRAAPRGRHARRCRRTSCGCRAATRSASGTLGQGVGCEGSRARPARRPTAAPAFGSYKPTRPAAFEPWSPAGARGRRTAGSSGSPLPRTPSCSRSSGCPRTSTDRRRRLRDETIAPDTPAAPAEPRPAASPRRAPRP